MCLWPRRRYKFHGLRARASEAWARDAEFRCCVRRSFYNKTQAACAFLKRTLVACNRVWVLAVALWPPVFLRHGLPVPDAASVTLRSRGFARRKANTFEACFFFTLARLAKPASGIIRRAGREGRARAFAAGHLPNWVLVRGRSRPVCAGFDVRARSRPLVKLYGAPSMR